MESLLSYGVFDWAVRDYEAQFAYRIIKLLPLSEQYRFRQRGNGKWFMRLVENLPDEFTSSKDYRGDIEVRKASKEEIGKLREEKKIRTEDEYYDAAELYQKKKAEAGVGDAIESLKKAFAEAGEAKKPVELYKSLHARVAVLYWLLLKASCGLSTLHLVHTFFEVPAPSSVASSASPLCC